MLELAFSCACILLYLFGAHTILGFFAITGGELIGISMSAIRTYAIAIPFSGLNVLVMLLSGSGKGAASISISLAYSTVLMIAGMLLMTALLNENGIWWSWLFAETVTLGLSALLLTRSRRALAMDKV